MSYMDRKNILSEGFFDFLKKIPKVLKGMSTMEKYLYKRNPQFKKAVDDATPVSYTHLTLPTKRIV